MTGRVQRSTVGSRRYASKIAPECANGSSSAIINCDNCSGMIIACETHGSDNPEVRICFRFIEMQTLVQNYLDSVPSPRVIELISFPRFSRLSVSYSTLNLHLYIRSDVE